MNKEKSVYKPMVELIEIVSNTLSEEFELIKNSLWATRQRKSDLNQGYVVIDGIYQPYSQVEHRILFEGVEINIVEMFIKLYSNLYERTDELFSEYALRTVSEISFKKIQTLFSKRISAGKKQQLKLIIMLADYAMLGINHMEDVKTYAKLFIENKHCLSPVLLKQMNNLLIHLSSNPDMNKKYQKVRELRRRLNDTLENMVVGTEKNIDITKQQMGVLFYEFSHLLHGSIFLNRDMFNNSRPIGRHRLRIYWCLTLSGLNAVYQIARHYNNASINSKIEDLKKRFIVLKGYIAENYNQIENSEA